MLYKDNTLVDKETGELIRMSPMFDHYTSREDYIKQGVTYVTPMTAKPYKDEETLEQMLTSTEYMAEEKLDGTRGTLHLGEHYTRVFSRNLSKKTNWFTENTDSLPHLRQITTKKYDGTILDGEMRIDGKDFKEVASTLNCLYDKAIQYQLKWGFITFHAFDIIYYKGVYIAKLPLWRRKELLKNVVKELNNRFIMEEKFTYDKIECNFTKDMPCLIKQQENLEEFKLNYPNLFKTIGKYTLIELQQGKNIMLNKRAWYEYIVANGGEGLMLKHKEGKYAHKRTREYTKLKKWRTWDCVVMGFKEPTKEYNGEHIESWEHWEGEEPVSKFYAKGWVGNIIFGVYKEYTYEELLEQYGEGVNIAIDNEEIIQKEKGSGIYLVLVEVGDCSGFDEPMREYFTKNKSKIIGECIEVKGQDILDKKKGTLRHPTFLRLRPDKDPLECTFENHINSN